MLEEILWRGRECNSIAVVDEKPRPFEAKGRPVVTCSHQGVTVGMFHFSDRGFGYWCSAITCSPIVAWRVAQILPRLKIMRNNGHGYDSTLCGLVTAMRGDRRAGSMRNRAEDLGMSIEELTAELERLGKLWPSTEEICKMWVRLPEFEQDNLAPVLRQAIKDGHIEADERLDGHIEQAEDRLYMRQVQLEHEEELIKMAAHGDPMNSLRCLMEDIGVTNLAFTTGRGEMFEPSHFNMEDLDHHVMESLIGDWGFSECVPLITTQKDPDDPSACYSLSVADSSITFHGADFGSVSVPMIVLNGEEKYLSSVCYDRDAECFVLTVRSGEAKVSHDDDGVRMTIKELRQAIGEGNGLNGPLMPGERAPWLPAPDEVPSIPTPEKKSFLDGLLSVFKGQSSN